MESVFVHWDDGIVYADNIKDEKEDEKNGVKVEKKEYFNISCKDDEFDDIAKPLTEKNGGLPLKGG